MSRRPVILTIAFQRPYAVRTHRGMEVLENRSVWGALGEICALITGPLNATPLLLATSTHNEDITALVDAADGILLPGGVSHIHPGLWGSEPSHERQVFDRDRDRVELAVLDLAHKRKIPVLGICRGMQMINVYHGGTLSPEPDCNTDIDHMCSVTVLGTSEEERYTHPIVPEQGGKLAAWVGRSPQLRVNSIHEQAVRTLGKNLRVEARAGDGVIEGIGGTANDHFVFGAQWHPDCNPHDPCSRAVLNAYRNAITERMATPIWKFWKR